MSRTRCHAPRPPLYFATALRAVLKRCSTLVAPRSTVRSLSSSLSVCGRLLGQGWAVLRLGFALTREFPIHDMATATATMAPSCSTLHAPHAAAIISLAATQSIIINEPAQRPGLLARPRPRSRTPLSLSTPLSYQIRAWQAGECNVISFKLHLQ